MSPLAFSSTSSAAKAAASLAGLSGKRTAKATSVDRPRRPGDSRTMAVSVRRAVAAAATAATKRERKASAKEALVERDVLLRE